MKKFIVFFFLISSFTINAQVSINTDGSTPDGSAMLEVKSTTKGMLIPRLTEVERNNISLPATALLVYQVDGNAGFYYYTGAAWQYLPASISISTIRDANGDTKVQVEKSANEDIIRFDIGGTETMTLIGSRLELKSPFFNAYIGENTGTSNSIGTRNTAVGYQTLMANEWGYDNTAFGFEALRSNKTYNNTAFGSSALKANYSGTDNTAMGYQALMSNQAGIGNTAFGSTALISNIGDMNTAFGAEALKANTSGNYNTAIGQVALFSNKANDRSTAIGFGAMYNADDRIAGRETYNTAIGYYALMGSVYPVNNTGQYNTAVGDQALTVNTSGERNTATGYMALNANTTGSRNTGIGTFALETNITGNYNTALGNSADVGANNLTNATALGYNATATASNMVRIGNSSVTSIGGYAGWTTLPCDRRFKKNVRENVPGIAFIIKLRPVTYQLDMEAIAAFRGTPDNLRMKEAEKAKENMFQTGFIAQEVESAASDLGFDFSGIDKPDNEKDLYGIRYAEFTVPLVKAIQEQQLLIELLQKQVEQLNMTVEAMKKK